MKGWFDTEERLVALDVEARSWIGTPFQLNTRVKGEGVSCHNLVYGIFENLGIKLPFESPTGTGGIGDQTRLAKVSSFLNEQGCFAPVDLNSQAPQPGDLVTFKTVTGEYHLGLLLPRPGVQSGRFIHAIKPWGATLASLKDPTYCRRLIAVFRLKPESEWS